MDRLVWLLCVVGHDAPATEPASDQTEAKTRSAEVVVVLPDATTEVDGDAYLKAIQDHGTSAGVEVSGAPPTAGAPLRAALERIRSTPVLGVFWFVVRPDSVSIFLLHARTQGVYVRELPRDPSGDAALVEMVGLVVASTAVALRDGQEVQMRTATAEEVALLPEPEDAADADPEEPAAQEPLPSEPIVPVAEIREPPSPRPSLPAVVHVGYLGEGFNTRAPWQSGVGAGLGVRLGARWQVGVRYGWLAASSVDTADALRVARHGVGLATSVDAYAGTRARVAAQFSAEVEVQRWRLDGASGSRVRGRMGPGAVFAVALGRGVGLAATVEGLVALNTFGFVRCVSPETACEGANRTELGRAWRIAPRASLSLTYRFALSPREETKKESPAQRLGLL